MKRRLKLTLEYIGTAYCGWQVQENGLSVQQMVTEAVHSMVGHEVTLVGASRTDAGVHALGQVIHFDTTMDIPIFGFLRGLNSSLPADIRVIDVAEAAPDFHARRDATGKWYRYLIYNAFHASAVLSNKTWHRFRPMNVMRMQEAGRCLVGEHDFSAYCAYDDQSKSKVRTVTCLQWSVFEPSAWTAAAGPMPQVGKMVVCDIHGGGFLKQMVRNIVGTLVEVGEGRRDPASVKQALDSRTRGAAGICAPSVGLYLMQVMYE